MRGGGAECWTMVFSRMHAWLKRLCEPFFLHMQRTPPPVTGSSEIKEARSDLYRELLKCKRSTEKTRPLWVKLEKDLWTIHEKPALHFIRERRLTRPWGALDDFCRNTYDKTGPQQPMSYLPCGLQSLVDFLDAYLQWCEMTGNLNEPHGDHAEWNRIRRNFVDRNRYLARLKKRVEKLRMQIKALETSMVEDVLNVALAVREVRNEAEKVGRGAPRRRMFSFARRR